jgi:integrase
MEVDVNTTLSGMPAIAAPPDLELIEEFVGMSELHEETLAKYRQFLLEFRAYLDARAGGKALVEVEKADVLRFVADLKQGRRYGTGADGRPRRRALSPSARKGVVSALRDFYGHCIDLYRLPLDPTARIKVPQPKPKRGLTLSDEQLKRHIDAPGRERDRVQAYLKAYTAGRTKSFRHLLWSDVDFQSGDIHFNAKFGNDYTLPMHPQLKAALLRWHKAVHEMAEKRLARAADTSDPEKAALLRGMANALADPDTAYVLLTYNGNPLCHSTIAKQSKWRAARVGILPHADPTKVCKENTSRVHPHAFRRTRGTQLRARGVDLADIADLLNHKDLNTTRTHYAFTSTPKLRKTVMGLTL